MPFVKIDTGMLDSTIWFEKDQRDIFLTALLMAEPREFSEPLKQLKVDALEYTGWEAPAGWYGFCPASGLGIIRRSLTGMDAGMIALRELGEPEAESRSKKHEGRRLIRIDGGYIVLNFMDYRDKDYTAADRMRRLRERKKASQERNKASQSDGVTRNIVTVHPNVTHAEDRGQSTESIQKQEQKPSRAKKPREVKHSTDPRHIACKEAIIAYYQKMNSGADPDWNGMEGGALGMFLGANPKLSADGIKKLLEHRERSEINHAERPGKWINSLSSYRSGALDRWGKPVLANIIAAKPKTQYELDAERQMEARRQAKLEAGIR